MRMPGLFYSRQPRRAQAAQHRSVCGRIPNPELYNKQHPELEFFGFEDGLMVDKKINCAMNEFTEQLLDPDVIWFDNNQYQWAAYLRGDLTDEARITLL